MSYGCLVSRRWVWLASFCLLAWLMTGCQKTTPSPPKSASPKLAAPTSAPPTAKATPIELPGEPTAEKMSPVAGKAPAVPQQDGDRDNGPTAETKPAPLAASSELFAGWEKPQVLLLISGEQNGYIEPCGCAGLENQKGGLSRRHSLIKQLRAAGWNVAPLDLGNQIRRFGPQQEIKFHTTVEGLKTMGYRAIGYGPDDLRLPVGEIIADAANEENGFVSANVALRGFEDVVPKFRVINSGGQKIAVTAVIGAKAWQKVNNNDLTYRPAEEALAEIVPKMQQQAGLLVLLSHGTPDETKALGAMFPQFKIVVTAGGADEPPAEPKKMEPTDTWLVEVGHKGMYVAAIGVYEGHEAPTLRYRRVALDKQFPASPQMHDLLVAYQGQLKDRGLGGLGLKPEAHPSGRAFIGSKACADCHTKAYEVWRQTPHAHATQTLTDLDPPRQFDPECLSCHVTGWEPQKFFPYATGFLSSDKTPLLAGNGCENCHGPGSVHVAVELGEMQVSPQEQTALREQMRLPLEMAEARCAMCHDLDNSPEFDFASYWKKVAHPGKD